MIFDLHTAGWRYSVPNIERLQQLGFQFVTDEYGTHKDLYQIPPTIELTNLGELMAFIQTYGAIILDETSLTIYDDYME
jgi:hypothetical protein